MLSTSSSFLPMFQHMEWADASVWKAVLDTPSAHDDRRLSELLHHLHMVQHSFLDVWLGRDQTSPDHSTFADLHSIREWARGRYAETFEFVKSATDQDLQRVVVLPWVARIAETFGSRFEATTLAETLFQVPSHSTYHRGQINARLRELGGSPPFVDFIAWIWTGRPVPDWT